MYSAIQLSLMHACMQYLLPEPTARHAAREDRQQLFFFDLDNAIALSVWLRHTKRHSRTVGYFSSKRKEGFCIHRSRPVKVSTYVIPPGWNGSIYIQMTSEIGPKARLNSPKAWWATENNIIKFGGWLIDVTGSQLNTGESTLGSQSRPYLWYLIVGPGTG